MALAHVLLSAEGNTLRLTATDTMVSLVADYVARVERPGEISVDAQNLFQVAKHLPEPTVHLKMEAGNRLAIESGKSEFHLVGMSAEDYPPLPSRDDQAALVCRGRRSTDSSSRRSTRSAWMTVDTGSMVLTSRRSHPSRVKRVFAW